jgi:hypothetical protein
MKISNRNNPITDEVQISTKPAHSDGSPSVYLEIGEGVGSRHAYLTISEARAIAYALLSYVEQLPNSN